MKQITTAVEINAPPERLWEVLTNFDAFPQWNPFIKSIAGETKVGARLEVRIEPPGGKGMTFRPKVRAVTPARELRWLGRVLIPGSSTASTASKSSRWGTAAVGSSRASASAVHSFRSSPARCGRQREASYR